MNKRAIAILGAIFILIVGTLGFLIFSKYASNKRPNSAAQQPAASTAVQSPGQQSNPNMASSASSTEPSMSDGIIKLTSDMVVSPALFYDGTGISYFDNQGNLYQSGIIANGNQITLGNKKQLDIPAKPNITKILWPDKGNDFIAQITDSSGKTSWSYFNSSTGAYVDLPAQIEALDWMPGGTQIAYIWVEGGQASLSIASPDATNYKTIASMYQPDYQISVSPDGSQILFYETNSSSASNGIDSVSIDGKTWNSLVTSGDNFGVLWSPDGQKFLFGKIDPDTQKFQLWLDDLASGEVKSLGLFTTPDKAVWASDSEIVYTAVPSTGTAGTSGLTSDSFFKIDVSTLAEKQYSSGSAAIDGQDLFLDVAGDKLFFKNAQDGGLYYLDLTQGQ